MMLLKISMTSIAILLTLQSCAFSMPQAENAISQLRLLASEEVKENESIWLASYRGYGAVLRPYTADGYTVFANESGDAIAFDGWVVRSLLGFDLTQVLTTSDDGWLRTSRLGQRTFSANCSEWQSELSNTGYEWRQICGINGHETVISIDETGSISEVTQAFGDNLGALTLKHLR